MSKRTGISHKSKKDMVKKVLHITETVFSWVIVAVALFMMLFTLLSVGVINRADRTFLGYKMFICKSDSMAATDFQVGDIVLTKEVDPSTLKEGDIITFISQDSDRFGMVVTHKIREKAVDGTGAPGFVTYGTTTGANDESIATYEYIIGQYRGRIPALGNFMMFLKTGPGFMLLILIPFLFVLLSHSMNVVREFLRWKREQMEEIDEKQQIIQSMAEKLKELKERYEESEQEPPDEELIDEDELVEDEETSEELESLTEEELLDEVQRIVQDALDKLLPPPPVAEQPAPEIPTVIETAETTVDEIIVSDRKDTAISEARKRKKKRSNKSKKKNRRKRPKKKGRVSQKSSAKKKKQNRRK